jgi:hypothetical protein
MTRNAHLVALAAATIAITSAQVASATPAPPGDRGPDKSVRPDPTPHNRRSFAGLACGYLVHRLPIAHLL